MLNGKTIQYPFSIKHIENAIDIMCMYGMELRDDEVVDIIDEAYAIDNAPDSYVEYMAIFDKVKNDITSAITIAAILFESGANKQNVVHGLNLSLGFSIFLL